MTRTAAQKNESRLTNLIVLLSDMQDGTAGGSEDQIEKRVKLCKDEDQALRELERQAMAAIGEDDTAYTVRRGEGWIKVKTHTADGSAGPVHYFEIEKVTESTA